MTEIKSQSYFNHLTVKIYESRGKLLLGLGQSVHTVQKTILSAELLFCLFQTPSAWIYKSCLFCAFIENSSPSQNSLTVKRYNLSLGIASNSLNPLLDSEYVGGAPEL